MLDTFIATLDFIEEWFPFVSGVSTEFYRRLRSLIPFALEEEGLYGADISILSVLLNELSNLLLLILLAFIWDR